MFIIILTTAISSCSFEKENMDRFDLNGIDVSHHQQDIDWQKVMLADVDFVFMKATEGKNLVDSLFCYNWNEIKKTNIRRGFYHFYRPTESSSLQAELLINTATLETGDLPPVLDVEIISGVHATDLRRGVHEWLSIVEQHYNIKPIIYTNLKFYNTYLAGHVDDYPLWIARYNTKEPLLHWGKSWDFWQYSDKGTITGISGPVDLNVFMGDSLTLEGLCHQPKLLTGF